MLAQRRKIAEIRKEMQTIRPSADAGKSTRAKRDRERVAIFGACGKFAELYNQSR